MNWEAIGAIGEILGAAAVVITLAFLVVQLRLNNVAIRAQTRSSVTDQMLSITHDDLANPRLLAAQIRAISDAPLEAEEQRLMYTYCMRWFRQWENVYYQYTRGTLDASEYSGMRTAWAAENVP